MSRPEGRGEIPGALQPLPIQQRIADLGFTLLEMMVVVAILAIIAGMGVPQYLSALRIARIGKAKHELVTIANAIAIYQANNEGHLPLTLHQAGFGGRLDPWGLPYCYLNYADGTGDGLQWAIEAGLVDPSAVVTVSMVDARASSPVGPRLAGLFGMAQSPGVQNPQGQNQQRQNLQEQGPAGGTDDVKTTLAPAMEIVNRVARPISGAERADLAHSMSRGAKVFTAVPIEPTRRRDSYLFPLNTDYDLFSLGPNGRTTVSLGESLAQDDVIRANNGGFFGTASEY